MYDFLQVLVRTALSLIRWSLIIKVIHTYVHARTHTHTPTASVAEWLWAWDTLTMFEATVCGRS